MSQDKSVDWIIKQIEIADINFMKKGKHFQKNQASSYVDVKVNQLRANW